MAYADYEFYKNSYLGIIIENKNDYAYFAERASEELAPYANCVPVTQDGQNALKRCTCRVADILFDDYKSSKYGQKISTESVSGYYSVGYVINDITTVKRLISNAVKIYLGRYIIKAVKDIII